MFLQQRADWPIQWQVQRNTCVSIMLFSLRGCLNFKDAMLPAVPLFLYIFRDQDWAARQLSSIGSEVNIEHINLEMAAPTVSGLEVAGETE